MGTMHSFHSSCRTWLHPVSAEILPVISLGTSLVSLSWFFSSAILQIQWLVGYAISAPWCLAFQILDSNSLLTRRILWTRATLSQTCFHCQATMTQYREQAFSYLAMKQIHPRFSPWTCWDSLTLDWSQTFSHVRQLRIQLHRILSLLLGLGSESRVTLDHELVPLCEYHFGSIHLAKVSSSWAVAKLSLFSLGPDLWFSQCSLEEQAAPISMIDSQRPRPIPICWSQKEICRRCLCWPRYPYWKIHPFFHLVFHPMVNPCSGNRNFFGELFYAFLLAWRSTCVSDKFECT